MPGTPRERYAGSQTAAERILDLLLAPERVAQDVFENLVASERQVVAMKPIFADEQELQVRGVVVGLMRRYL